MGQFYTKIGRFYAQIGRFYAKIALKAWSLTSAAGAAVVTEGGTEGVQQGLVHHHPLGGATGRPLCDVTRDAHHTLVDEGVLLGIGRHRDVRGDQVQVLKHRQLRMRYEYVTYHHQMRHKSEIQILRF